MKALMTSTPMLRLGLKSVQALKTAQLEQLPPPIAKECHLRGTSLAFIVICTRQRARRRGQQAYTSAPVCQSFGSMCLADRAEFASSSK